MTYFLINKLYPPLTWASIFGATNAYNISLILSERSDKVTLTKDEQALYEEHFLTHGVTPKQFHMIMDKSKVIRVPKDQVIVTKQISDNKKLKNDEERAIPKRLPPRNDVTTREDAIEAFRQILLGEPGIGRA
jgi:hypothetical protein